MEAMRANVSCGEIELLDATEYGERVWITTAPLSVLNPREPRMNRL